MQDLFSLVHLQTMLDILIALLALATAVLSGILFGQMLSAYAPDLTLPHSSQTPPGPGSWSEAFSKRPRDRE